MDTKKFTDRLIETDLKDTKECIQKFQEYSREFEDLSPAVFKYCMTMIDIETQHRDRLLELLQSNPSNE